MTIRENKKEKILIQDVGLIYSDYQRKEYNKQWI